MIVVNARSLIYFAGVALAVIQSIHCFVLLFWQAMPFPIWPKVSGNVFVFFVLFWLALKILAHSFGVTDLAGISPAVLVRFSLCH